MFFIASPRHAGFEIVTLNPENPYSPPTRLTDEPVIVAERRMLPRWVFVSLLVMTFAYFVLTMLLLTSSSTDRFYGFFFVPIATLLSSLTISVRRFVAYVLPIAILTGVAQGALCVWLTLVHGFHFPTFVFAILPTIAITGLCLASIACRPPGSIR